MTSDTMTRLIFAVGLGQLAILAAAALVPFRLHWQRDLRCLSRLHRQMYWVYGGYVVLSTVAFALLSLFNARELASGGPLARGVCAYIAVFWGVRFALQGVFDVREHLTARWLKAGYFALGLLFAGLTAVFASASLM